VNFQTGLVNGVCSSVLFRCNDRPNRDNRTSPTADETQNSHWHQNANQNPRCPSQVSFQTASLKKRPALWPPRISICISTNISIFIFPGTGNREGMEANQDCTNSWSKNSLLANLGSCWGAEWPNGLAAKYLYSNSNRGSLLVLVVIHEYQGEGAILSRKCHTWKYCWHSWFELDTTISPRSRPYQREAFEPSSPGFLVLGF